MTAKRQNQNATGESLRLKSITMRNKLKRREKRKDASCPSKKQPRAAEVTTVVLSDSSCSNDDETESASMAAKDTHGSDVAAAAAAAGISAIKVKPLQEHGKAVCAKDIKIAPIFLHAAQHSRSERSSDGELLQKSLLPSHSEDVQRVRSQQRSVSVSTLTERKGCWRGQLSPSALHSCLEEIQTSNPAFPVRAVFSILQRKTSLQDSGDTD